MSKDRRGISISPEVNEYLSRDGVNASELVEKLVREHMKQGDTATAAIQVQLNQKKRELDRVQTEEEQLQRDIAELEELQRQLTTEESAELETHLETLRNTPADPTNPAIRNHANALDITPQALVRELEEYKDTTEHTVTR